MLLFLKQLLSQAGARESGLCRFFPCVELENDLYASREKSFSVVSNKAIFNLLSVEKILFSGSGTS